MIDYLIPHEVLHLGGLRKRPFSTCIGPVEPISDNKELKAITNASEVIITKAKKGYTYKVYVDNQASPHRLANPLN